MEQHVKILGILNIVYGSMGAIAGIIVLLVFGGLAGLAGLSGDSDAATGAGIMGILGFVIAGLVLLLAAPSFIAGFGLLRLASWARVMTIVLSAFHLISVPFGTLLGGYGLWVLLKPETEALFRPRAPQQSWPAPTV